MTSFNVFAELTAENNNDPQWFAMIQSLLNYKVELMQKENRKNTVSKQQVLKELIDNYKLHTINGVQYIRAVHLTEVILKGKLAKSDMYNDCMVALPKLVKWIIEKDETKIKKGYLKRYELG